jgi:hypothetical protein
MLHLQLALHVTGETFPTGEAFLSTGISCMNHDRVCHQCAALTHARGRLRARPLGFGSGHPRRVCAMSLPKHLPIEDDLSQEVGSCKTLEYGAVPVSGTSLRDGEII